MLVQVGRLLLVVWSHFDLQPASLEKLSLTQALKL